MESIAACFLRSIAAMAVLPLGGDLLSLGLKLYLAALCAFCLVPTVDNFSLSVTVFVLFENLVLGMILGLPLVLAVQAAEWVGELFDSARGQTMGAILDPAQGAPSMVSLSAASVARATLLGAGVLPSFVLRLHESLVAFPLLNPFSESIQFVGEKLAVFLAVYCSEVLRSGVPLALLFLAIECVFAVAAKLLPGISLSTESFALKLGLGFLILRALAGSTLSEAALGLATANPQQLLQP